MSEGLLKIWRYLIPLVLLAVVATCDTDFNMKNPFSESEIADTISGVEEAGDSLVTKLITKEDSIIPSKATLDDLNAVKNSDLVEGANNSQKMWRLVIGSVPQKEKAEILAAKSGNPNVKIMYVDELSTYRLVYGSYTNVKDAQYAFSEIQETFPEAWMVFF